MLSVTAITGAGGRAHCLVTGYRYAMMEAEAQDGKDMPRGNADQWPQPHPGHTANARPGLGTQVGAEDTQDARPWSHGARDS